MLLWFITLFVFSARWTTGCCLTCDSGQQTEGSYKLLSTSKAVAKVVSSSRSPDPGPERHWGSSRGPLKWSAPRKMLRDVLLCHMWSNKCFVASKIQVFTHTSVALRTVLRRVWSQVPHEEINCRSFRKTLQGKTLNFFYWKVIFLQSFKLPLS